MKLRTRTWVLLSVMCFVAAGVFWMIGERRVERRKEQQQKAITNAPSPSASLIKARLHAREKEQARKQIASEFAKSQLPHRLSNTTRNIDELAGIEHAILLRNALIDTSKSLDLSIPAHLKAQGDPGAYIVQSRGYTSDRHRELIQKSGAQIVSYIPNNSYLVRATAEAVKQLESDPMTMAVLPFEPYYKLSPHLLRLAVEEKSMPANGQLNVLFFPGTEETARQQVAALGGSVVGEDRSPFGRILIIRPDVNSLAALAQLPAVQALEPHLPRKLANDLSRERTGVSTNTTTLVNHLGLTGTNVLVNINDSGVNESHPEFTGRLQYDPADSSAELRADRDGHGTHVAGTIGSSGENDITDETKLPSGSIKDADFRGMAPKAKFFVMRIDQILGPEKSNEYLQETAASNGAKISNNSWGYLGSTEYDLAAASYDAAVRDALPRRPGEDSMTYVFAAGNEGFGNDDGTGGEPSSLRSPGTAKNVITVSAAESQRRLTNTYKNADGTTNTSFMDQTDNFRQIAGFSSRGNVGIGQEGSGGRFKPDVTAPGAFIVSTRSSNWNEPTDSSGTSQESNIFRDQKVQPNNFKSYSVRVSDEATELRIRILANASTPSPIPVLEILAGNNPLNLTLRGTNDVRIANPNAAVWYYRISNTNASAVSYDVQTLITYRSNGGDYYTNLTKMNDPLKPNYRYESGTSMAAPVVTGVLALMQEFLTTSPLSKPSVSPAFLKALLINGARSVGPLYSKQIDPLINYQGWGMVNLTNSVPEGLRTSGGSGTIRAYDQQDNPPLKTGERHTRALTIATEEAKGFPLRITLVYTDPPGNPSASIKLVNDLDLIVTDLNDNTVYYGNNIPFQAEYTVGQKNTDDPKTDLVNNVENVLINPADSEKGLLNGNYLIEVVAKRVNVNAVTSSTGTAQDYALVVSVGNGSIPNALSVADRSAPVPVKRPTPKGLTSGQPLLEERVGAHSSLANSEPSGTVLGDPAQWNFYVYTNKSSFTNVAFVTFLPPNLSKSRLIEADLDLYVSKDPGLTNLVPAAVNNAIMAKTVSRSRGGSETVTFSNAVQNDIYYIGVKSEDQQAAVFGMFGVSSQRPFSERDEEGNLIVHGVSLPVEIPDGSPQKPKAGLVFAIATEPIKVKRVIVTNTVTHGSFGDLQGNLSHRDRFAILNNHSGGSGTLTFVYDDSDSGDSLNYRPTDGPGSLQDFVGEEGNGTWLLTMVDNTPDNTGRVDEFTLKIEPQPDDQTNGVNVTVGANRWYYDFVDVTTDVTNLVVRVGLSGANAARVEAYIRKDDYPDQSNYDKFGEILPPGGEVQLGTMDSPPLTPGRYYIGVFNPNASPVDVNVKIILERGGAASFSNTYTSTTENDLIDDALIVSDVINVTDSRPITDLAVGIRLDHPRVSDLAIHLVSPQGTRVLLMENRGGTIATSLGEGSSALGNLSYVTFTDNTNRASGPIKFALPPFTVPVTRSTTILSGFESANSGTVAPPGPVEIWTLQGTNKVSVVTNPTYANSGNKFLALIGGKMTAALPTKADFDYELTYSYRGPGLISWWKGEDSLDTVGANNGVFLGLGQHHVPAHIRSGLNFNGTDDLFRVNDAASLNPTNGVTAEMWINVAGKLGQNRILLTKDGGNSLGHQYELGINASNRLYGRIGLGSAVAGWSTDVIGTTLLTNISTNKFYHVALSYEQDSKLLKVFVDGRPEATNTLTGNNLYTGNQPVYIGGGPLAVGLMQPYFQGIIDEPSLYSRALSDAEIESIFQNGKLGKSAPNLTAGLTDIADFSVSVDGAAPKQDKGGPAWQTRTIAFVGNRAGMPVQVNGGVGRPGVALDDFRIVEISTGKYYLPEESMKRLQGENALGNWKLEIRDTRKGAGIGKLLKWRLQMNLENPGAPATKLTHKQPSAGTATGTDFTYFIVEVPSEATSVIHYLNRTSGSSPLELWFNQSGLPTGNGTDDVRLLIADPNNNNTLTTSSTPKLIPGQRYYLGVRNTTPGTSTFTLQIEFDKLNGQLSVTPLQNGITYPQTIPRATNTLQYFQFDVPTNAVAAAFEILNPSGDVNLVVREGTPLPNPTSFDYESTNQFKAHELVLVDSNSFPVKLSAGRWYLGVYNREDFSVNYSIRATWSDGENSLNFVTLTNNVAILGTNGPGAVLTNYYRFVVDPSKTRVLIELYDNIGDVDMVVRRGRPPMPSVAQYDYKSERNGTQTSEQIVIRTNSAFLNVAGEYYIGVPNRENANVTFTLRAMAAGAGQGLASEFPLILDVQPSGATPSVPRLFMWNTIEGELYEVEATDGFETTPTPWTVLGTPVDGKRDVTIYDDGVTPIETRPNRYYRVRQLP